MKLLPRNRERQRAARTAGKHFPQSAKLPCETWFAAGRAGEPGDRDGDPRRSGRSLTLAVLGANPVLPVPHASPLLHAKPTARSRRRATRGFTLLEMIVATLIMAVAVVGLLNGIAGATRNAARVRDYDRIVQLARLRMNDLMLDPALTPGGALSGQFDPAIAGGLEAGWQARASIFEMPPNAAPNQAALGRIELQIWWMSGAQRRTFNLEAFREYILTSGNMPAGAAQ